MSEMLRIIMAKHRITTKILALETGLSTRNLSSIINEHHLPSMETCYRVAEGLSELSGKNYHVDKVFPHLRLKKKLYAR